MPNAHTELCKLTLQRLDLELKNGEFWDNKTTGVWNESRQAYMAGNNYRGPADILGVVGPNGLHVELEVKTGKGKQTADQKAHQARVESQGGYYRVIRNHDDIDEVISALKNQ